MRTSRFFWQVLLALVAMSGITITGFIYLSRNGYGELESVGISLLWISLVGFLFALQLSRPLENLRNHLKKMAQGLLTDEIVRAKTPVVEILELMDAVEKVRQDMKDRVETILLQKQEQEAVLASMAEGVVAIDKQQVVLQMNSAATKIFGLDSKVAIGRPIFESIRIPQVIEFVEESFKTNGVSELDFEMRGPKVRHLQMHATPLRKGDHFIGLVLVFSDVTRIRELEGMRKNFVANVSHELRTPLTSIQGFAETLLNPNVKDQNEIKRFLEIIQRHAARLSRIIEDILTLSRIERDTESEQIEKRTENLRTLLDNAVELCLVKAQKKNITLITECPDNIVAILDPYLMEQAIVNLIDNAIRYSDEGKKIFVRGRENGGEIFIEVADQGIGIAEKQLPRIFERFYRVDKARSRDIGGTGLGLSIVKHIALAHKGQVDVKSELGVGTTFTIQVPKQS